MPDEFYVSSPVLATGRLNSGGVVRPPLGVTCAGLKLQTCRKRCSEGFTYLTSLDAVVFRGGACCVSLCGTPLLHFIPTLIFPHFSFNSDTFELLKNS